MSRVFTDVSGRRFRLTFFVTSINGELKGRLVSVEPLAVSALQLTGAVSDGSLCLPVICSDGRVSTQYVSPFTSVVSPFWELYFLTSQPTRAPAHI